MTPSSSTSELLEARIAWTHACLVAEIARGRRLGYLAGEEPTSRPDPDAILAHLTERSRHPDRSGGGAEALDRCGLSAAERDALWLLATCEIEPALARLVEALVGPGMHQLSVQHVERITDASFDRLARLGLVEIDGTAGVPRHRRAVRASDRAIEVVRGVALSAAESPVRGLAGSPIVACATQRLALSGGVAAEAREAFCVSRAVVIAVGLRGLGRRTLLTTIAVAQRLAVLDIDARKLAKDPASCAHQLRAIALECKLLARTPLIANLDALVGDQDRRLDLVGSELAPMIDGLILATCGVRRPEIQWDRPVIAIELGQPTSAQRATLWHDKLGQGTLADAEHLASLYPLAPALIHHAAAAANARVTGRLLEPEDLYTAIRSVLDDRLGQFAKRVSVTQTWDDLVLGPDQMDPIIELMARVRERRVVYEQWGFAAKVGKGLGVSALFSGPPGTGKTMVAALIAREVGLELYQVDISKIVSKWIGETEKNLAALFDAAEAGHAILLFDEADALFGKRTDVKSSNDRHANLETNYLLQRLESFTGICLLTSNHERSIDPAFQRRLSLHVRFELPEERERAHLWTAMLPKTAPVAAQLDVAKLAKRFEMSGGYIRNAALRAAFLAADEGTAITALHLERAACIEYEGMGRIAA